MRCYKVLLLVCCFAIFGASQVTLADDISWTGCGITKKAFMAEIAKAYEAKYNQKINLSGGGATKGIRAAAAGTSDMGGTCRHRLVDKSGTINTEEQDAVLTQVAWDAIVAIVNPANPVSDISLKNLKEIYSGKISNWQELGGPDKRIILVTRNGKNSGVGLMFRSLVFHDPDYEFKARSLKVKSTGPLEKKVEKAAMAFGMDGISSAKKRAVKFLSIDGVEPSKENLAAGKYPLFRPLYLVVNKKADPDAKKVIDFVLSDEGQAIIASQGTVNLKEGEALARLWDTKKSEMGL